jgi:hypothetical protein
MQLVSRFILSPHGLTVNQSINSCFDQIRQISDQLEMVPVMATFFIKDSHDYMHWYSLIKNEIFDRYNLTFSIISQPPAGDQPIAAEILFCSPGCSVKMQCCSYQKYVLISDHKYKYIVAAGIQFQDLNAGIEEQSLYSFKLMQSILQNEGFDFSNVIRQWNYIEQIIGSTNGSQHYQVFNDVRSNFYAQSVFSNGYPAATGIGMKSGGVNIDFIATNNPNVTAVKNPVQIDAHQYSKDFLGENNSSNLKHKTTPKFERAKMIQFDSGLEIFVSGTASIQGQVSQAIDDVFTQTLITLENINKLIIPGNLYLQNKNAISSPSFLRVYVKKQDFLSDVKRAIETTVYKHVPILFVIADICRPELLVEIEGVFSITN